MMICSVNGIVWNAASPVSAAAMPPEGRRWEMVSPLEKNGGEINGINGVVPNEGLPEGGIVQASSDGSSITYLSLLAFPDSKGNEPLGAPIASQYLSTRSASGWSIEDITTAVNSKTYPAAGSGAPYEAFSSDLSKGLMLNGNPPPIRNPPLGGAPPEYVNYYLRDQASGQFNALLTSTPAESPSEFFMELQGTSPDLNHILITSQAALPPVTTRQSRGNLYEWTDGQFQPVNILPGVTGLGTTAPGGASLGMGRDENHTISENGTQVFWGQEQTSSLFVRKGIGTGQVETVQIDATRGGSDPSGRGEFKTASSNGMKAFFTDRNRLTPDATAGGDGSHEDLYMFDVERGQLIDLTVDGTDPGGAAVRGVVDVSSDGSYIYFVAEGGVPGTGAAAGHDNLYMWHESSIDRGTIRFIAALSSEDNGHGGFREPGVAHDWDSSTSDRTARVTADGHHLLFMSEESLTGYDNRDNNRPGVRDEEIYIYNAITDSLACVSCNPGGTRPIGPSGFPGGTPLRTAAELGTYQSRVLSADGNRVFFDSKDALSPQDTNGVQDVYEWVEPGIDSCARMAGCIFLLSGAASTSDSAFVDASANGADVFFVSRASLVPRDTDQLRDLYDARVGGGFPEPAPASPACEGEGCLPQVSAPSSFGSLASATFTGNGNVAPAHTPTVKVKAKKKPTKKAKKRASKRKKKARKAKTGRGRGSGARARR
jgi:hypothetical protein